MNLKKGFRVFVMVLTAISLYSTLSLIRNTDLI